MDYHTLRSLADSWGLVFMTAVFVIAVAFVFRPSAKQAHEDAASIPFKEK